MRPGALALRLLATAIVAVVALALAGLFATALLGAPLTDRAASTCAQRGEESEVTWRWLPPAWTCTRLFPDGRAVSGRIHVWSPGTFSP